jgi:ferric-dicitrate binding protein FerR (iron transport regulator)
MKKASVISIILILTMLFGPFVALAAERVVSRSFVISSAEGDVVLTKGGSRTFQAREGTRLAAGYTLTTGRGSSVRIRLDDNSVVTMAASTKVDVSTASQTTLQLTVLNGSISVDAATQATGNKTGVKAGNSTMGLRGTLFMVTYLEGILRVTLLDGELEGTTPDGDYVLTAGFMR